MLRLYTASGGPAAVVVEGEWLDVQPAKGPTGLTRVRRDPEHNFNRNAMYCFLDDCEAYNVALMSTKPDDDDCDVFEVVSKCGRQAA